MMTDKRLIEDYLFTSNFKQDAKGNWICICGKKMYQIEDSIAKKKTGYLWRCSCMPKGVSLSIG